MRPTSDIRTVLVVCFLSLAFLMMSCSSGPAPPAKGTPAWYWQAAQETWAANDVLKTSEHLASLVKPDSEYADRAQPWRMVITGGLATGYMKIANACEQGSRANKAASSLFRKQMNDYRTHANRQALQFAQTYLAVLKANREGDVPIAFTFPQGSALSVSELAKLASGAALSDREMVMAERKSLRREVLLTACSAVGAEEDTAKAQKIFSTVPFTVPKATFLLGMAKKLHTLAGYYSPFKMDQPDRVKLFNEKALETLKSLPENDETKKLIKTIEKELKNASKRRR